MNIKVTRNDDGFLAQCKDVQGGFAEGDTPYEALYNLFDILNLISEYRSNSVSEERFREGIEFNIPEFA